MVSRSDAMKLNKSFGSQLRSIEAKEVNSLPGKMKCLWPLSRGNTLQWSWPASRVFGTLNSSIVHKSVRQKVTGSDRLLSSRWRSAVDSDLNVRPLQLSPSSEATQCRSEEHTSELQSL